MPHAKNKLDGRLIAVGESFRWDEHTDWERVPEKKVKEKPKKKSKTE